MFRSRRSSLFLTALLGLTVAGCDGVNDLLEPSFSSTLVPGHARYDQDNNGYPDAGKYVNGHYTSVYAYDSAGDYYWDLGDGRIQGTVGSVDELDQATLSICNYVNNYRADFGNDAFMDHGSIKNLINCRGYDDNGHYGYMIVSDTDPRFTGDPEWSIWGTWEYHVLTVSGQGNLTGPQKVHLLRMLSWGQGHVGGS